MDNTWDSGTPVLEQFQALTCVAGTRPRRPVVESLFVYKSSSLIICGGAFGYCAWNPRSSTSSEYIAVPNVDPMNTPVSSPTYPAFIEVATSWPNIPEINRIEYS